MTVEERFERMEHVLAGHIEQAKKDYEENRMLWRQQQQAMEQGRADWQRELKESTERWQQALEEHRQRSEQDMARIRSEMAARDEITDKRIADLVGAIMELIHSRK